MKQNMDKGYAGEGIYRENILDHYKNPHNHGALDNAGIRHTESNPLCGDVITINIKLNGHKVENVKFIGSGCAISQASMSMLTDRIKGRKLEEIEKIKREDIVRMLGIEIGPVRTKCAVLGLVAVKEGIKELENKK